MFKMIYENVRNSCPLIHNITNYVTVNDCANIVLACGASPIMADDKDEVAEITTICSGLNINIGTLNSRTIDSMLIAGKKANELNHKAFQQFLYMAVSKACRHGQDHRHNAHNDAYCGLCGVAKP